MRLTNRDGVKIKMIINIDYDLKGSILDIGGGGEAIIGQMYGDKVTAIDNRQEELDEAPNCCTKLLMDAEKLSFFDDSFDNVTFFYTLMYMSEEIQRKAILEATRVLKTGGIMCIWDCAISSAYPEPFVVDLDIQFTDKRIERQLEKKFIAVSEEYACVLLTGPRQVGKSTMLRHLMEGTARAEVSLDDLEERRLAKTDPAMFLKLHPAPVLIDEVQYAPELFSYIKIAVDNGAAPGSYWLTGSQAYRLMEMAQESLAGRTAILHMSALSQSELCGAMEVSPFSLELDELQKRKALLSPATPNEIYQRIWDGALPGHRSGKYKDRDVFYSSYIQTYIDRDVTTDIPGVDKVMFADFIRAAACRSGQMLNLHDIAGDVGVSDDTAKRWMKELEKSGVVYFLHPYSNNLLKRTIKTPKMYFFDTGLVCYLTRYSSPEILMNGAINGAILENYVVSEIIKTYSNSAKDCLLHYYRDKNSNEIDLIMESDGQLHPIEIKKSINPPTQITGAFKLLDKASVPRGTGAIICLRETLSAIDSSTYIVPVWMI